MDAGPGTPAGLCADVLVTLWRGCGMGSTDLDGAMFFASDGTPILRIALPERCANLCFGARANSRLFIVTSRSVYALCVNVSGAPNR